MERSVDDQAANERVILQRIAGMDPAALERLIGKSTDALEASRLDPKAYALARIAALVALDGSPTSFVWEVGDAQVNGVSDVDLFGLLVAIAPIVGSSRIVSAAAEISYALTDAESAGRDDADAGPRHDVR
jgi:alkylhydroperoxidase/carboxymuconolactone decarboxylase family protein YurZ